MINKKVAKELKRDRSIYQDQTGLNDSKKSNKKKKVKFAILLDGLFIYFSSVIEPFRISVSLIPFWGLSENESELLLSSKSRSEDAT